MDRENIRNTNLLLEVRHAPVVASDFDIIKMLQPTNIYNLLIAS